MGLPTLPRSPRPAAARPRPGLRSALRAAAIAGAVALTAAPAARAEGPVSTPAARAEISTAAPACRVRPDQVRLSEPLPRVAERLVRGEPLKIVAFGSSSTFGLGATDPSRTYPSRLQAELQTLYPKSAITVVNKGVNGNETRDEMLRFDRDVMAEKPDLVIWQVGTNTLLNRHDMWPVFLDVREGVRRVRTVGGEVVLMNPQYSPRVLERPDYSAMIDLVAVAGNELRVGLFDRFALMKSWAEVEHMPFSTFVTADGLHMNDWAYGCIAHGLAVAIAGSTTRTMASH
ncbi:SGNH/GDSL hydrolase family protein [Siculibacillus lacustris]|uniref:SGNH/GDSL hydrolase family protein n=1 Tax=Siculibacillus lacustris TaxID=1549641 RepID=A0A4Q9VHI7_9HYPH|nr:SGNH/GDSL hydrolase family protein [Siculibacillus lacustris]TBW34599.1 SGNH/GDSL hydrolase family protein [Siculibacillus lacustris]